jgi:hypothetical protein
MKTKLSKRETRQRQQVAAGRTLRTRGLCDMVRELAKAAEADAWLRRQIATLDTVERS